MIRVIIRLCVKSIFRRHACIMVMQRGNFVDFVDMGMAVSAKTQSCAEKFKHNNQADEFSQSSNNMFLLNFHSSNFIPGITRE